MVIRSKLDLEELEKRFGHSNIMGLYQISSQLGRLWAMGFLFQLLSVQNKLPRASRREESSILVLLVEILWL